MTTDIDRDHPWYGYAFSFVSPDAIARRLAGRVVDRVLRAGFTAEYCRLVQVGPEQLDAAFAGDAAAAGAVYRYRILDRLFAFGPVLAVIYRDRELTGNPYRRLKELKGATDPGDARPGSIRADLGAINTILGLMHSADSPAESAEEAALFLPGEPLRADRPPAGQPDRGTDGASLPELVRLLDAGPPVIGDFQSVLAAHRARVIAACFADLSAEARARLPDSPADWLGAPGAGAAIAAGLRGGADHPASSLLCAEWVPGQPSLPVRDYAAGLAALRLAPDPWEELVLTTSAHFAPVRRAARAAEPCDELAAGRASR
jgi:nucleoside diphosphate kinase